MNFRKFSRIVFILIILAADLQAADIDIENRIPVGNAGVIIIDQTNFKRFFIGINIVPIKLTVSNWNGNELLIRQNGKITIGNINPLSISVLNGEESMLIKFKQNDSSFIGVRKGSINIEILIPETWNGCIELKNIRFAMQIENLKASAVSGNIILEELKINSSCFNKIDLCLGTDSSLQADEVHAEKWIVTGKLGDISAKQVSGEMDIHTLDGNIEINYSDFNASGSFFSKLGDIEIILSQDSELKIDLSSSLESVKTNLPVHGSISENSLHKVKGNIGNSENLLTVHSGDGQVSVFYRQP